MAPGSELRSCRQTRRSGRLASRRCARGRNPGARCLISGSRPRGGGGTRVALPGCVRVEGMPRGSTACPRPEGREQPGE